MNPLPLSYRRRACAGWLLGRVLAAGVAVLPAVAAPVWAAAPDANPAALMAACDAPAVFATLQPAAQRREARAIWLDRRHLQWPGLAAPASPADGTTTLRYRLVGATQGGLLALPGQPVQGADQAWALVPVMAPLTAQTDARFRHVPAGLRLQVVALRGQNWMPACKRCTVAN